MKKSDLLKNKGYWTSKIQLKLFKEIDDYMKENNLNRTQLAKKLGVSKGYITQVLNGDFNHSVSKLVELSLAIGKIPEFKFKDLESEINNAEDGARVLNWEYTVQPAQSSKEKQKE
ncbi:MAG: helix-turn-helix transcriptional regulator [Bacteroidales bacterium]|nr:helix-turn-helix transcriptional regulator [Bacteroidales bacterium]MCF8343818.1 helix-turn-helix transcriptional regulator [Bacteroidales bacterium]MCF8350084.1 helix-turn-helix transcriptional regulator [Bacteroidales bacterium]MCF8374972.1 helix-turn-helix transcriptional regulator [Bacteroidales bacterium]MCF8402126.1 helix-turn-helix transcriptional regulator [Bacteroidales bacterium]